MYNAKYSRSRYRFKNLPSQAVGHYLFHRLPLFFKDTPMLKAFETRLSGFLASQEFENVYDVFVFDWGLLSLANIQEYDWPVQENLSGWICICLLLCE